MTWMSVEILLPMAIARGNCQNFFGQSIAIQCHIRSVLEAERGLILPVRSSVIHRILPSQSNTRPSQRKMMRMTTVFGRLSDMEWVYCFTCIIQLYMINFFCSQWSILYTPGLISINPRKSFMSPYSLFRSNRGIHHFYPILVIENTWKFFSRATGGMKIVLIGTICVILGLFFPWFQVVDNNLGSDNYGPFSLICGGVGWWISLFLVVLIIQIFSYDFSQKIQKNWNFSIDQKNFFSRMGWLILLLSIIICTSLTGAARTIGKVSMVEDFSWLVLTIIGGLLIYIGGIIIKKTEEKISYKSVFIQGVENEHHENYKKILGESQEGNMKLPI